jgi:hypothetical protein
MCFRYKYLKTVNLIQACSLYKPQTTNHKPRTKRKVERGKRREENIEKEKY